MASRCDADGIAGNPAAWAGLHSGILRRIDETSSSASGRLHGGETTTYKSLIVLLDYERVNLMDFPESVQGRISQIEAKLDART